MQILVRVLAAPVSMSSYALCLVNSGGLVLLVSSIPFGSYNLSTSSSTGFPELCREGFDGDFPFRHSLSIVSGCPYLPSVLLILVSVLFAVTSHHDNSYKGKHLRGLAYSFRGLVHFHPGREHGTGDRVGCSTSISTGNKKRGRRWD